MKLDEALKHLTRPEVTDIALQSGKLPCIGIEGKFQPISQTPLTTEGILEMLSGAGGSRFVENLTDKPARWQVRVDPYGMLQMVVVMRAGVVQARVARAVVAPKPAAPPPVVASPPSVAAARTAGTREIDLDAEAPSSGGPESAPADALLAKSLEIDTDGPSAPRRRLAPREDLFGGARNGRDDAPESVRQGREEAFGARQNEVIQSQEADVFSTLGGPRAAPPPKKLVSTLGGPRAAPPPKKLVVPRRIGDQFEELLYRARELHASDLHIIALRPPLMRIAGELVPQGEPFSAEAVEALLMTRVPERLKETLSRDGSCDFALLHEEHGRFRANISRQRTGLKATMRLIPAEIPTLASLGLPESIGQATKHHQGLIVVTGPTGHGKTSTLAALVDIINSTSSHHVITVEDPLEYLHPRKKAMLSQREVGTHTKSFGNALKGSLREDPDVIVVGELRDTETVRMALSASETGHLVISTMNTPSAAKTIDRLIDLFPPGDQQQVRMTLAGGLRLIVSQRLLANTEKNAVVAAAEVLPGNVALWNLIRENKTFQIPSLQQRGKAMGIIRLDDSLAELVRGGKTSLETAMAYAEAPDDFAALVQGARQPAVIGAVDRNKPQAAGGKPAAGAAPAAADKSGMLGSIFGRKG